LRGRQNYSLSGRLISLDVALSDADVETAIRASLAQVGMGFWASKTLLSAVELGVFSTLAKAIPSLGLQS
jgi:hypothetical protein